MITIQSFFDKDIYPTLIYKADKSSFDPDTLFDLIFDRKNLLYVIKSEYNKVFGCFISVSQT